MYLKKPYTNKANITSPYGERIHPITKVKKFHKGVDIGLREGTALIAPLAGSISMGRDDQGYGIYALLNAVTEQGTKIQLLFGHLRQVIKTGQVKSQEFFALSGNTGLSSGPHLHLETRLWNGKIYEPKNPVDYINFA